MISTYHAFDRSEHVQTNMKLSYQMLLAVNLKVSCHIQKLRHSKLHINDVLTSDMKLYNFSSKIYRKYSGFFFKK